MSYVKRHVTVANLLSGIALFAALGTGAAVALPDSGADRAGKVKYTCPDDMKRVVGICYDRQPNAGEPQLAAQYVCAQQGKELPTQAEFLRVANTNAFPNGGELWTDSADSAGNAVTVKKIADDNIPSLGRPTSASFGFHCIREANLSN